MYQLLIFTDKWYELDLRDLQPAINFQRNNLGSLSDRQIDYSQQLSLPKSSKNKIALNQVIDFDVQTDFQYSLIDCRLFCDNFEILQKGAKLQVISVSSTIDVQVKGKDVGFYSSLKALNAKGEQKTINDLTAFGTLDATNTIYRSPGGFSYSEDFSKDFVFAIADFSTVKNKDNFAFNQSSNKLDIRYTYPFVKMQKIISAILTENGVTSLIHNIGDIYSKVAIPCVKMRMEIGKDSIVGYMNEDETTTRNFECQVNEYTAVPRGNFTATIHLKGTIFWTDGTPYTGGELKLIARDGKGNNLGNDVLLLDIPAGVFDNDYTLNFTAGTYTVVYIMVTKANTDPHTFDFSLESKLTITGFIEIPYSVVPVGEAISIMGSLTEITQEDF